ncbi:hypothetical protein NE237_003233 [Protea cynaroides]|uniref:NAD(P)-binding domain-containing protein n=1 Tax=Protea cynaroides TaxID=273540 RepID=A0A9Q0KH18_9MAGN|nr:hypothetical protein NE237_003233 [Protea cynaroides]
MLSPPRSLTPSRSSWRLHLGCQLELKDHVAIDKRYFRPSEVDNLKGDSSKARRVLGWKPKVGIGRLAETGTLQDLALELEPGVFHEIVEAGSLKSELPKVFQIKVLSGFGIRFLE